MENNMTKNFIKTSTILILALFIFLVFSQAQKKFTLDELDFPIVAKATSETGRPIYYRGETAPNHLGLYHPPLYIYALAAQIKIFGFSENTIRAFGLGCTLVTAWLALCLSRRLVSDKYLDIHRLIFLSLFLLNPYAIANTTLPDIDSTILPPLITAFVLLLFSNKSNYILAIAFCLLLWAKLTTPLALIPFSILYWKLNEQSLGTILSNAAKTFIGGFLLFVATYWVYCTLLHLPFLYVFEFLIHSFTKGSASTGFAAFLLRIHENFSFSKYLLAATTIPFSLLFFSALTFSLTKNNSSNQDKDLLFIVILGITVTIFYCSLIAPFGGFFKYPFAVFQFMCLGASSLIIYCAKKENLKPSYGAYSIVAFVMLLIASQYFFVQPKSETESLLSSKFVSLLTIAAGVAIGFGVQRRGALAKIAQAVVLIVWPMTLGASFGMARYEAIAQFPTKYSYGQLGMEDTVSYLRANLQNNEIIWSMKDIGFYSGDHYIENYDFFFDPNAAARIDSAIKSGVRFFVATKDIGEDRIDAYPIVRQALDNCCRLEKNFGNFYIYVPK